MGNASEIMVQFLWLSFDLALTDIGKLDRETKPFKYTHHYKFNKVRKGTSTT